MTPTAWVLRVLVVLGPLAAVLVAAPAGHTPSPFVLVLVAVGGVLFAAVPDSFAGVLVMSLVVVWWALWVADAVPVASVAAAAALLTSHVAATLLAMGPSRMLLAPSLVTRWALRGVLVWPAALVVWLVADAFSGHPTPTTFWLAGLAAALAGAVAAALLVPARSDV